MFYNPWVGMLLAYQQKMQQFKIRLILKLGLEKNIANMKLQLKQLGFSYDWTKELKHVIQIIIDGNRKCLLCFRIMDLFIRKNL